jgi:hypothetical protein
MYGVLSFKCYTEEADALSIDMIGSFSRGRLSGGAQITKNWVKGDRPLTDSSRIGY